MPQSSLFEPGAPASSARNDFVGWLQTLAADARGDSVRLLIERLQSVRTVREVRVRLTFLELAFAAAERLLVPLEGELDKAALPLTPDAQKVLAAANDLLKELAGQYGEIVGAISSRWLTMGFARPLRIAVLRAVEAHAWRLAVSYRVRARGSESAWQALHELYRIARSGEYATEHIDRMPETIEHAYKKALLLAFAEPSRFHPGDLDRVIFYLDRHADLAKLTEASAGSDAGGTPSFLIDPHGNRAGYPYRKGGEAAPPPQCLLLDCLVLTETLRSQAEALARGREPVELGLPLVARRPEYRTMMRNLLGAWLEPPARRDSRQRFKPRVHLVVGFDELWSFLSGPAFRRRFEDGRFARQAATLNLSEWSISNESPSGFGLRYMSGDSSRLTAGEIVGVRPREQAVVHICSMRRIASAHLGDLELGLEKLCPEAAPASAPLPQPGAERTGEGSRLSLIVLSRLPQHGNRPAILAPPGAVQSGLRLRIPHRGRRATLEVGELLEQYASCDMYALTPLTARDVPRPPSETMAGQRAL